MRKMPKKNLFILVSHKVLLQISKYIYGGIPSDNTVESDTTATVDIGFIPHLRHLSLYNVMMKFH